MKKIGFIIWILLILPLFSIRLNAFTPLDCINSYEIKVDPRDDATLDMYYHINWTVLNDESEGPLSWVKIGVPNYHLDEIKSDSSTIDKISYTSDDGAFLKIEFKKKYYKGETVDFSFSFHQSYMFQLDNEKVYFDFIPGWFDEIEVKSIVVLWNSEQVKYANTDTIEDGYYVWRTSLGYGKKLEVGVNYNSSFFPNKDDSKTYTNSSINGLYIIIPVAVIILLVILILTLSYKNRNMYYSYRGFGGYHSPFYYYFPLRFRGGYGRKGEKLGNPTSPSGFTSHGSGSSCACACACACAGGGRAGCSRKDFYHTNFDTEELRESLTKEKKEGQE